MTKLGKWLVILGAVVLLLVVIFFLQKKSNTEVPTPSNENIEILGNEDDLVSFSFLPGTKVSGFMSYGGSIKGGYFFEGNIQINILDVNKNLLKAGFATATSEWMTADPVIFSGSIDLTGLPVGPAYFEIHNDNASGLPENDKFIQIPIVIE